MNVANVQPITTLVQTEDYIRSLLERVEKARALVTTARYEALDHSTISSALDVYSKATGVCQEARVEIPRVEERLRLWLLEPMSPEDRRACEAIGRNLDHIRRAADFIGAKVERLRANAIGALRGSRRGR